jgi:aspartyl-tRNA synthetase
MLTSEKIAEMEQAAELQQGDIMFVVADADFERAVVALGALRCHLAERLSLIKAGDFAVTWVNDFPLFEYSEEEDRLVAKHHPFTAPKDEDLALFKTNPAAMRAKAYDLVINGDEMGGGSMRIYNSDIQKQMFEALGFNEEQIKERFGFFVDAFKYGTPPHGGLAFGLDRLIMVLSGTNNIKDVIAFPKIQNASDLMTQAPSPVEDKQLTELALKCEITD